MSSTQKTLRVICIIIIVFAVIGILAGLAVMGLGGLIGGVSATDPSALSTSIDGLTAEETAALGVGAGVFTGVIGFIVVISALIDLLIGILGLRGAKDPAKIGPFSVFCIIGIVLNALSLIAGVAQGSDASTIISSIISLALVIWCYVLARKIKETAN